MSDTLVTYKGRHYRLMWHGSTKFGQKAKLAFKDGSKEFWVNLDAVEGIPEVAKQETTEDKIDRIVAHTIERLADEE